MKKGFFYIVFCLNVSLLFAQSERFNIIKTQQLFKNDSISFLYNKHTTSAPFFYRNPKDTGKTKLNLSLSPLLALEPSYSLNTEKSFFFNWNIGVQAKLETNKGWSGEVNYVRNFFDYSGFYAQHIEQTNDVYGYGYSDTTSGATTYISGFIAYQPNKTFTF